MKHALEAALVGAYPRIYQGLAPYYTGGSLFECSDGWHTIIRTLSAKLETEAIAQESVSFQIFRVKEKLGRLRVQLVGNVPSYVWNWVTDAEQESTHTCEICSAYGELRVLEGGGVRTMCERCFHESARVFGQTKERDSYAARD